MLFDKPPLNRIPRRLLVLSRNLGIYVMAYLAAAAVVAMFKGLIRPPSWIVLSMGGLGIVLGTLRGMPLKAQYGRRPENAPKNHSV